MRNKDSVRHILLVTTNNDTSLEAMLDNETAFPAATVVIGYSDEDSTVNTKIGDTMFDLIYFRDPFNAEPVQESKVRQVIERIVKQFPEAVYIDDIQSYDDLLIEDKWSQYKLLGRYMPTTSLLDLQKGFTRGRDIAKERLSSRGKGIVFDKADLREDKDYIVQKILNIKKEYRVYGVNGKIIKQAAVRSSKTNESKVKVTGIETVSDDVVMFVQDVYKNVPYLQLVGFDIAITDDGISLLEINRSCQFKTYNELTGRNLWHTVREGMES